MKKNFPVVAVVLISALFLGGAVLNTKLCAAEYKIITDMDDQRVEVPVSPEKIACMHCISAGIVMILGKGNCISLIEKQSPWAYKYFPEIKNAASNEKVMPEQMVKMGIDLVFYTPGMNKGEPYKKAGLKSACSFSSEKAAKTVDEVMDHFIRQVAFFGDVLGPGAIMNANKYNAYLDKKVKAILSITSKIDQKDRPRVYYGGKAGKPLASQGNASVIHWNTETAGGDFLPRILGGGKANAEMSQVLSWNPDIILLSGESDSLDIVTKDPEWASLDAVKNGKVYLIPEGIFTWDYASGENVLLMIYLAKIFHPDLFIDWDMIKEMKTFYSEVYGITVTDEDAQRILKHRLPA